MVAIAGALTPVVAEEGSNSWLFAAGVALISIVLLGPVAWGIRSQLSRDNRIAFLAWMVPLAVVFLFGGGLLVVARPAYEFEFGAIIFGVVVASSVVLVAELVAVPERFRVYR